MIVLDTNVLSELMKWQPDKSVVRWIGEHQATSLFITTLTQAEIFYGLEILPAGKRRTALRKAAKAMFELDFAGRILPFDIKAAQLFATIAAERRKIDRTLYNIFAHIGCSCAAYSQSAKTSTDATIALDDTF